MTEPSEGNGDAQETSQPGEEMSETERASLRTFIAARRWQFASTMPHNPHWYTVREWCPGQEADFEEFVRLLRGYGHDELFGGKLYRYLDVEGFHYWTMGAPIPETTVINRKPLRAS